jgi:L-lactate dehydrogenase complex protein LldG
MTDERANILARVGEALRSRTTQPAAPIGSPRDWLPEVADPMQLFRANATDLRAEFHVNDGTEDWPPILRAMNWNHIATHHGQLTDSIVKELSLPTLYTDAGYDVHALERCDVGITECDALIAQTGSVLVTSRSAGGRALSVLPPHHVVLARRDQLVADLPAAYALLRAKWANDWPSFISLITGPSRTGDIERILVLGAHGPRRLTILCA